MAAHIYISPAVYSGALAWKRDLHCCCLFVDGSGSNVGGWKVREVFTCISLKAKDVEHFFVSPPFEMLSLRSLTLDLYLLLSWIIWFVDV